MTAFADGIDEARRGLWRSALESFETAVRDRPDDAAPVLACAQCHLVLGAPEAALVWLETSGGARAAEAEWAVRRDWLIAAARLQIGDHLGAERAAAALPNRLRARAEAVLALDAGDYARGVPDFLAAHRPVTAERPSR